MESGAWKSCTVLTIQEYHNMPTIKTLHYPTDAQMYNS